MSMLLSAEQTQLRDSAADFLQAQTPVSQQRQLRDDQVALGFDAATWLQMVEMGWPVAAWPEAHGGLEAGYLGLGSVFEYLGRQLAAQPLLTQGVLLPELLLRAGSAAQQAHWLPLLAAGQAQLALAMDEASGQHLPGALHTHTEQTSTGWLLHGSKHFVIDGFGADAFVVLARGADNWGLWLVPSQAAGVTVQRQWLVDSRNHARVDFANVVLTADMALTAAPVQVALDAALDRARACLAAEALGLLREVFERTVAYLKERVQFDVPIGSFQALQHRAARLYVELELLESSVLAALEAIDAGHSEAQVARLACVAKARASDLCERLCNEAVQLHGGIGVTDELDIGLFFKRARVLQRSLGDGVFHRRRYAQLQGF